MRYLVFALVLVLTFSSCKKESIEEANERQILDYLEINGLTAEKHSSGLHFIVSQEGDGDFPNSDSTVEVYYRGYLTDNTEFDSRQAPDDPLSFGLDQVIEGWRIGIPLFSRGGSGTLFIPSDLGYGNNPPIGSDIPANGVIIFDVELVDF